MYFSCASYNFLIYYDSAASVSGSELTYLFAPPEELIFGDTAPDRAAINRMRDISHFSDEKTMHMHAKYKYGHIPLQCCGFC